MPMSRTRTPWSSRACHVAFSSREAAEEDEVASLGDGSRAERGEPVDDAVALVLDDLDRAEHDVGVLEGDPGDRLGRADQVVGQPDEAQRVDELGCRDEVAEAATGEGERLAHGARHDEPRVLGEQRQRDRRSGAGELGVGLVDDDDRVGAASRTAPMTSNGSAVPVGLFGEQRKTIDGSVLARLRRRRLRRQVERIGRVAAQAVDPRRAVRLGDDRVHRVAGVNPSATRPCPRRPGRRARAPRWSRCRPRPARA